MSNREPETRILAGTLSLRSAPAGSKGPGILAGYAAKYNTWSQPLSDRKGRSFIETIKPGAFDLVLRSKPDTRCLMNHDNNIVLGRTISGTLSLTNDAVGLHFTCQLPDTQAARDLHTSVARRDISQCSFGFSISLNGGESWNRDYSERTVLEVDELYDVSVVTSPAYLDTSVDARNRIHYGDSDAALRARVRALGARIALDDATADDFDYDTASVDAIRIRARLLTERIQRSDLRHLYANDSADISRMVRELQRGK